MPQVLGNRHSRPAAADYFSGQDTVNLGSHSRSQMQCGYLSVLGASQSWGWIASIMMWKSKLPEDCQDISSIRLFTHLLILNFPLLLKKKKSKWVYLACFGFWKVSRGSDNSVTFSPTKCCFNFPWNKMLVLEGRAYVRICLWLCFPQGISCGQGPWVSFMMQARLTNLSSSCLGEHWRDRHSHERENPRDSGYLSLS